MEVLPDTNDKTTLASPAVAGSAGFHVPWLKAACPFLVLPEKKKAHKNRRGTTEQGSEGPVSFLEAIKHHRMELTNYKQKGPKR